MSADDKAAAAWNDYVSQQQEEKIEELERQLAASKVECDLHQNRLASILLSGKIDKHTCGDVQKWYDDYIAELAAANERIKQLEDNRTVAAANSLANMLAYEDAVAKIKRLEDWKQSALEVEREWNPNAIATMLGGQLGESQREVIQREVPKLLARIQRLEDCAETAWGVIANVDNGSWQEQRADWREAATRWRDEQYAELSERKAKESKP